jgi:iron complex outermembrane recepter protein
MLYKSVLKVSLLPITVALATGTSFAQSNASNDAQADDSIIIVTAQKREQNIQEVPIAISAISADYLESRDITSIDDIGALAPNVKFERAPSNKTISQIAIRGSVTINPAVTWVCTSQKHRVRFSMWPTLNESKYCAAPKARCMGATAWRGRSIW